MPRRDDLHTVLVVGSGPIVIGQAAEFDYSGAQACKALRAAGYRIVLVNSNPATIMTDPELADATYVEPITAEVVAQVIAAERPDALLPTLGGQTALNVAVDLARDGVLEAHGVELVGAGPEAIALAEDRQAFAEAMRAAGLDVAGSTTASRFDEARAFAEEHGFPLLVRASYTLGGAGSGLAHTQEDYERLVGEGLAASPVGQVQVDESMLGWKEFELEVMRDGADNQVVVCSIENLDPMGVHTGDSITIAPVQTLSDREYQEMRDAAFTVMRTVGVSTGGSNVQFAVHPTTGRMAVVEMNPRVSRSSALASKATGFPIAKIAALLAVGYRLDEIRNDITRETQAAFEPTIDYVVTKIPRFNFEKFPEADPTLTTRMKSVGEVMAIGRTFTESLGKAVRSLENGLVGLVGDTPAGRAAGPDAVADAAPGDEELAASLAVPREQRLVDADIALDRGWDPQRVAALTGYDPWFVDQLVQVGQVRAMVRDAGGVAALDRGLLRRAKRVGLSDAALAVLVDEPEETVRARRLALDLAPVFKTVDTCAAEFPAYTPYHYSSYEEETEVARTDRTKVIILGSGPNRIGQGIEFDYCCVHAVQALSAAGYETVMVNCNPETVSTDYDTADRLYFEPLTLEDVLAVYEAERQTGPVAGVLVQLGGQTPLKLARQLEAAGVTILGTPPEAIDLAEHRARFAEVCEERAVPQPPGGTAGSRDEAQAVASRVGYPVLVRPSYVLGGRAMAIVYTDEQLTAWLDTHAVVVTPDHPVLIDRFLEGAVEVDVDAVYDGRELYVGGVLEHIEEAGVHSGDSACVLPPYRLGQAQQRQVRDYTEALAAALGTRGLINIQFAVRDDVVSVIEANPRASRTVPFTSKATGVPLAKVAARVMVGDTLQDLRDEGLVPALDLVSGGPPAHIAVKEAVLPFNRFPGVDTRLGPEMRSTGEVMGIDADFGIAFAKSQAGTSTMVLPAKGTVFASIADHDKQVLTFEVTRLAELGFTVLATEGTAAALRRAGVEAQVVPKVGAGSPDVVDRIVAGDVDLVLNTPAGAGPRADGYEIRTAAVLQGVPCITTLSGILAAIQGIEGVRRGSMGVRSLQSYHRAIVRPTSPQADPPRDRPGAARTHEGLE